MRVHLPGYLARWLLGSALTFALTAAFDSLALAAGPVYSAHFYTALAAGGGILFAGSICVLVMTGYVYLYLGKHDI